MIIMKKIFISIFVLLLLSGCKVRYNIDFEDDSIYEYFGVVLDNKEEKSSIEYLKENDFYVSFNPKMIKYNKKIEKNKNTTSFNYDYLYELDDYKKSMVLSTCFDAYNIIQEDYYYLITTSEGLKCMTLENSTVIDELDIVISSNHKLIDTNADEINNYEYIWHIDKNNYKDKNISLKLYKDKKIFNYKGRITKKLITYGSIFLVILIIISYIYLKRKRRNKV